MQMHLKLKIEIVQGAMIFFSPRSGEVTGGREEKTLPPFCKDEYTPLTPPANGMWHHEIHAQVMV